MLPPPLESLAADSLCDRFEDALLAGERPWIESWAAELGAGTADWLAEMAALELFYRIQSGENVAAAEYLDRFPSLAEAPERALIVVGAEYRARAAGADRQAVLGELAARHPDLARLPDWDVGPWADDVRSPSSAPGSRLDDTTVEIARPRPKLTGFLETLLDPPDRPGDLGKLGEYRIAGILGEGGMGIVLRAEDPALDRPVAIKLMRPDAATRPGARERFEREARSAAAVRHPRVVEIYSVGSFKETPYLVMPLMPGQTLQDRLRQGSTVGLVDAVRFTREAADGLAAAHARGLIHRDIKPANIWLETTAEGSHVRLLDFGLARGSESTGLTQAGSVLGTPNYMAPEQASGQSLDGRADLFSLGCVLYELITGREAFPGKDILAVLHALANTTPPAPQEAASGQCVPESLSRLTMRLLEKDARLRPASAEEVSAELRRLEAELARISDTPMPVAGTHSAAPTTAHPAARSLTRVQRWSIAAAVAALGTVCLVGSYLMFLPDRQTDGDSGGVRKEHASSGDRGTLAEQPVDASALRVESIDVSHFVKTPQGDTLRGILGQGSFAPSLGDRMQIKATLSRPGYAYLIVFRPDGVADLCFPRSEDEPPPLSQTAQYPLVGTVKAYGLREGSGLWVVTTVTSESPLPAYRNWLAQRSGRPIAWTPVKELPLGMVWRDKGDAQLETLSAAGVQIAVRGKDESLDGPYSAIHELIDSLRGPETSAAAIAFHVSE